MPKTPHHKVGALKAITERMLGEMDSHPHALLLQAQAKRLHDGVSALDSMLANQDPVHTKEAHALKIAKSAKQFDRIITDSINRAGDVLRNGLDDIQKRIESKIDLKPNAFAEEVRSVFRGLKMADKADMIERLVADNDGPALAAIVKAPTVLTGITDQQRTQFEQMILNRHAAEELKEREDLEAVHSAYMRAQSVAEGYTSNLTDPRSIAAIQARQDKAKAATDSFEKTLEA